MYENERNIISQRTASPPELKYQGTDSTGVHGHSLAEQRREGAGTDVQRQGEVAGRAVAERRSPAKRCLPPATRKAPAMSAGQSEVRQTEPPWSTDDGRVESLRCSLKAVLSGMVHVSPDMNTLAKKLVRDGWSECVTDDIVNVAAFRRRGDVTKWSKVLRKGTRKRR